MRGISKTVTRIERSGIREIMDQALNMENVVRLEVGEPLFKTPLHIQAAAKKAIDDGFTKYTANAGVWSLREKIADDVNRKYHKAITGENVVVSSGAVGALSCAIRALADAGDEVLIPDPGWPNYHMMVESIDAVPVRYHLNETNRFLPSLGELQSLVTPKTTVMVMNSPSNPLGTIFPKELTATIVDFAEINQLYVISDEVYENIIYEGRHESILAYDSDRMIGVYSFSKSYSMTGFRVGYAVADTEIIRQMAKLQEATVSCANSIAQIAAQAAISGPQECIDEMVKGYQENLETATILLDSYEINYLNPKGAFYIWVDVGCADSKKFAKEFLAKYHVSVAPGRTFGPSGSRYIRLSLASEKESIEIGISRLAAMLGKSTL